MSAGRRYPPMGAVDKNGGWVTEQHDGDQGQHDQRYQAYLQAQTLNVNASADDKALANAHLAQLANNQPSGAQQRLQNMRQYSRQNSSKRGAAANAPPASGAQMAGNVGAASVGLTAGVTTKQSEQGSGTLAKSSKGTRDSIKTTIHKRDTIKNMNGANLPHEPHGHQINVNYQSGPNASQLSSISPMTQQQLAPQKIGVHGYLSKRQMQHLTQMQA